MGRIGQCFGNVRWNRVAAFGRLLGKLLFLSDRFLHLILQGFFRVLVDGSSVRIGFAGQLFAFRFFSFRFGCARFGPFGSGFGGRLRGFGFSDFGGVPGLLGSLPRLFRFFAGETNFFLSLRHADGDRIAIRQIAGHHPVRDPI